MGQGELASPGWGLVVYPPFIQVKFVIGDEVHPVVSNITIKQLERITKTKLVAHVRKNAIQSFQLSQQRIEQITTCVDVLVSKPESQTPAVGKRRLVVNQINKRLLEFEMEWSGNQRCSRVRWFVVEVVSERHAISGGDGQDLMLDVAKERYKTSRGLCGGRKLVCEIESPLFLPLT